MRLNKTVVSFCGAICFGLALRAIVSLHSYSGAGTPPIFGDYEAQRHWQEICVNLPTSQWYRNSTDNDLLYWGLDYPPLTAYHSMIMGKVARIVNASFVELHKSRGIESKEHKFFMRLTVLLADIFIYIPALFISVRAIQNIQKRNEFSKSSLATFFHLVICLTYPGQILIDNGHFQYNNISLGLAAMAIASILYDRLVTGSILFTLALNYKQMELYHAIPIFVYLLQSCLREKSFLRGFVKFFQIGLPVVLLCVLLWWPWMHSIDSVNEVIERIFPIHRGVFEDKVSNVWCAVNVVVKLKKLFRNQQMALICLTATLTTLLPTVVHLFQRPTKLNFLYSLFTSSMCFFLFSFQVHEKSILLPALPAMLLFPFEPFIVVWFLQVSTCSMFPLLAKDNLSLAFIASWIIFNAIVQLISSHDVLKKNLLFQRFKWLYHLSNVINLILVLCNLFAPVPQRLPHIYTLAISVYCCLHFIIFVFYINFRQFKVI